MKKLNFRKFVKLFSLFLAAVFLFLVIIAADIWNFALEDEKKQSDTIIVLGAASNDISISPVFRERVAHAIRLYNNGYADNIIITGGFAEGNKYSDSEMAKAYAVARGIPEEDVFIEEKSTITEENLKYAKEIMDEKSFESAIIVSDPLHMRRAVFIAEDMGINAYSSPTTTSRYISLKTKVPFLLREEVLYIGYIIADIFR